MLHEPLAVVPICCSECPGSTVKYPPGSQRARIKTPSTFFSSPRLVFFTASCTAEAILSTMASETEKPTVRSSRPVRNCFTPSADSRNAWRCGS